MPDLLRQCRKGGAGMTIEPVTEIGHRARRGSRGGRPPQCDPVDYRGRNVVERGFNRVRQWRGLATRYDKLAIVYRSAVLVRAVTSWTKAGCRLPPFSLACRRCREGNPEGP
jgi:hypothetical protein